MNRIARAIERSWYAPRPKVWLMPLATLFAALVHLRRLAYARGWFAQHCVERPVWVIGNVSVGGSGKTPLVIALVERARARGLRVGVVSRGYGGQASGYPLQVTDQTAAEEAGDEPLMIARRTGVPVVVDPDRVRAATQLCHLDPPIDLIIADDGLQHYRLARTVEIAVRDARRGEGNGWMLPAGPLREPRSRLRDTDLALVQGDGADFVLVIEQAVQLVDGRTCALASFVGSPVHALAGIGDPARFFDALRGAGLRISAHPFPDHHRFTADDLVFDDHQPVLMTEKDAVKCRAFARPGVWVVPARAEIGAAAAARIDHLLDDVPHSPCSRPEPRRS